MMKKKTYITPRIEMVFQDLEDRLMEASLFVTGLDGETFEYGDGITTSENPWTSAW